MKQQSVLAVAGVALLFALPAHGQTKCTDAQGKVFYQQGPCPGAAVRPAPKVVKAEKKVESPAEKAQREKCERIENDIKEMRAVLPTLRTEQQPRVTKNLERAQQDYSKTCPK